MKKAILILLTAFMLVPASLTAQDYQAPTVKVSSDKIRKNGVLYYAHVVTTRQTLFSISKAYGVSVQDIYAANPELNLEKEGLKDGTVLLIPTESSAPAQEQTAPAQQQNAPEDKKPAAAAAPAAATPAVQAKNADDKDYFIHTVKWYEDLNVISLKYNISKDVIIAYNGLKDSKVSKKQELRIPLHPELVKAGQTEESVAQNAEKEENVEAPQSDTTSVGSKIGSIVESIGEKIDNIFADKGPVNEVSISLLLPFTSKGDISNSHYDFYSGVLLATKDLAAEGINVDLSVFDVNKGLSAIAERLKSSDLILGPVSKASIDSVLSLTNYSKPVISPLDQRVAAIVPERKNLIQAPSPANAQYRDLISWIKEDFVPGDKIILITEDKGKVSGIADYMDELGHEYSTVSYGILQSSHIADKIQKLVSVNGTTRFVIASDSEAFVNDAVRNVNLMAFRKFNVVLYAPAKFRSFETIEVENLHNANVHMSSTYFVNYDSVRIRNFLLRYRALCKAEPTPFAYQGYDAAYYFIKYFTDSPYSWKEHMKKARYSGLQSDFLFEETGEDGGLINKAVRRAIYHPDYSIETL